MSTKMGDRAETAKILRRLADALESDPGMTLAGSLKAQRWIPLRREEVDAWFESGMSYVSPLDVDRTQTTTFTFDLQAEVPSAPVRHNPA